MQKVLKNTFSAPHSLLITHFLTAHNLGEMGSC